MKLYWMRGLAGLCLATAGLATAQDTPQEVVEAVLEAREQGQLTEERSAQLGLRCLELAEQAQNEDDRYQALYLVLQLKGLTGHDSLSKHADKALDALTANHADDPERLAPIIAEYLKQDPRGVRAKLLEKTTSDGVRVACEYASIVGRLEAGDAGTEEGKKQILEELVAVSRKYGEQPDYANGGRPWSETTQKLRAKLERNLFIGAIAPEIEAPDLNGVSFKLSDYRGKVVVLDFWGNW